MSKSAFHVAVLTIGLLSALGASSCLANSESEGPPSDPADRAAQFADKEQQRLGIPCSQSVDALNGYFDALVPVLDSLKRRVNIESSAPILAQGARVTDIMRSCARLRRVAIASHLNLPIPAVLEDSELQSAIWSLVMNVNSAASPACQGNCLWSVLNSMEEQLGVAKEHLAGQVLSGKP